MAPVRSRRRVGHRAGILNRRGSTALVGNQQISHALGDFLELDVGTD
jgi:hypothetical protein